MDARDETRSTKDLLDNWREAERTGDMARSAAEVASEAVEAADAAKAAAADAQDAVMSAAKAVDRAKEASDLAASAAIGASRAAQLIYAEAQKDSDRTAEELSEADAAAAEAAGAFHEAQDRAYEKDRA